MPFRYPFFYHPNYNVNYSNTKWSPYTESRVSPNGQHHFNKVASNSNLGSQESNDPKKNNPKSNSDENYFFELFGLKLYFDDILLMCLLFFLYQEGVKDDELFLSLILLLLS